MALAMDAFWSDPTAVRNAERLREQAQPHLIPRLTALFERYSGGKKNDTIEIDGTLEWCKDLGVEPEDPVMLAIAEMCKASEMGSFERKGWIDGWAKQKSASSWPFAIS
jgi:DCN1-like protein 1/2